jgi:5-methyltetrahydrofolate--homocysteine methyltransferase
MVHVASEMQRENFTIPLLIGGATTSRRHTAIKIEPVYSGPVIHVQDASKGVPVLSKLLAPEERSNFTTDIRNEYAKIREQFSQSQSTREYWSLEIARNNAFATNWLAYHAAKPKTMGVKVLTDTKISVLRKYIDWTPFFMTWELKGRYPDIFNRPHIGEEARKLYDDAQGMLDRFEKDSQIEPRAVFGLFPANSDGDDIIVYENEERKNVKCKFHTLRQQLEKRQGQSSFALADFIAPVNTGIQDYIGAFVVAAGHGLDKIVAEYEKDHDDYNSILAKALADRLAEAYAEYLHERVRKQFWGYAAAEELSNEDLISESYSGIRPAPGYPACPDHTEKATIFNLLAAEKQIGVELTESYAMAPGASVSGLYFMHPNSQYFGLGKILKDQVIDYAKRKNMSVTEVERWLSPNLGY